MKKVLFILSVIIFLVLTVVSCKTTEDCPAYGQVQLEDEVEQIV